MPSNCKERQESAHIRFVHLIGMALVVKEDEPLDPRVEAEITWHFYTPGEIV